MTALAKRPLPDSIATAVQAAAKALGHLQNGRAMTDPGADLNQFLLGVEQRAFAMTVLQVRNREDALDIVQDSMLQLAQKYADRPSNEWAALFFRILRNRTTDHHRRAGRTRQIFGWFTRRDPDQGEADPLEQHPGGRIDEPDTHLERASDATAIATAVAALPERQREAFLLRSWEGLDVARTAEVMGCSTGSVKTHHFRALAALRQQLGDHWPNSEGNP